MNPGLVRGSDVKEVKWHQTPVPQQFAGALRSCYHLVGDGKYLALVGQSSQSERALAVVHLAGQPKPTVEKYDTLELARTNVQRIVSENTIIPRLW